jgi:superfamily II DNA/RNA helicase
VGFADLSVRPELVAALSAMGIVEPTAIQAAALPVIATGRDAHVIASTGTGKTLAYALPLFAKIDAAKSELQAVVIAPTHELAIQIHKVFTDVAQRAGLPVRALLLIGASPIDRQIDKLKKKPHVAVGSTGRINELIALRKLKPHTVKTLVIDEADRLLAPENMVAVRALLKSLPRDRQLVFASATERPESLASMEGISPGAVRVAVTEPAINPNIEHLYLVCEDRKKIENVRKLFHAFDPERVIVFVHKNERADTIWRKLEHHDVPVADLHAALDKHERRQAMEDFRSGAARILIASDVAARGLDLPGVSHVFNLDVPTESKAYLHRVGRTGRAGAAGTAVTLMNEEETRLVRRFERELGIVMKPVTMREGRVIPVVGR